MHHVCHITMLCFLSKMKRCLLIFVFVYIAESIGEDCTINPNKQENALKRLRKNLISNYDTSIRPVKDATKATNVTLFLVVQHLEYIEMMHSNELKVHSWAIWHWIDESLLWDPNNYENITKLFIKSNEIWVPDILLHSSSDMSNIATLLLEAKCMVEPQGFVSCVPPVTYSVMCTNDLTLWPYDTHTCTLHFQTWGKAGEHINIYLGGKGYDTGLIQENHKWKLLNVTATRTDGHDGLYPSLKYDFVLQRHSAGLAAITLIPAIVLSVLILTTFWIGYEGLSRTYLCSINIIIDLLYLQLMPYYIMPNGDSTSIIITFYRDLLLLAGICLFITIIFQNFLLSKSIPPQWIYNIISCFVESSPGKVFMYPHEFTKVTVKNQKNENETQTCTQSTYISWGNVVDVLDRLLFCIMSLILFSVLISYIPRNKIL